MKIEVKYPQRGDSVYKKDTICGSIELDEKNVKFASYELKVFEQGVDQADRVFNSLLFSEKLPDPSKWIKSEIDGKTSYKKPFTHLVNFSRHATLLEVALYMDSMCLTSATVKIRVRK